MRAHCEENVSKPRKNPKGSSLMKIEKKELLFQLQNCVGVTEIAKKFGVTPRGLRKRIQENPDLQLAQAEEREKLLDTAQSKLGDAVKNGDACAVKFILETWGKSRGFTKMMQVEAKDEPRGVIHMHFPDDGRSGPDPLDPPSRLVGEAIQNADRPENEVSNLFPEI